MAAFRTLATLQIRRGDAAAPETLAEHRRMVGPTGEAQRQLAALGLEAGYAWLHDLERLVPKLMSSIEVAETMPAHAGIIARL